MRANFSLDNESMQLHGTWRCTSWINGGKKEDRNYLSYTFNPDGSAASGMESGPMRWWIKDGLLCIEYVGQVESVISIHRFEMPDPNTLVLYVKSSRYGVFNREVCCDAPE